MIVKKFFAFVFTLFLLQSSYAELTTGDSSTESLCSQVLANDLILNPENGFHYRGFLGTKPERTEIMEANMKELGIDWWGMRIYIMPSLEIAQEFDNYGANQDPLIKGVYLIDPSIDSSKLLTQQQKLEKSLFKKIMPERNVNQQKQLAQRAFDQAFAQQGMWYSENGVLKQLPEELVKKIFTPDNLKVNETEIASTMPSEQDSKKVYGKSFLYQRGWFYTKLIGIIDLEEYIERHKLGGSKTYMKLRKAIRTKMQKEGWSVRFNTHLEAIIGLIKGQKRIGQGESSNRFTELDYASFRTAFAEGKLFTVEVYDGNGNVVAGTLGYRSGNVFHPETLVYLDGIDKANYAVLALLDRLSEAGVKFLNTGMVTTNTANLGGKYIPRDEYVQLEASLPKESIPIDFTSEWNPYPDWLQQLRDENSTPSKKKK
ncbi:MAG: hypothetical protein KDD40_01775 [Bdellovibrionales bacterium]|nr:hypothetical protein [Bdellovibrionales bacterium]